MRSGRTLAVLSGDPDMLYDIEAGCPVARVAMPDFPAGRPVAAVVDGGGCRVWDTATGKEPAALQDIAVHDGRLVAMTVGAPDEDLFPQAGCMAEERGER
jgi:hypothetical protein